MKFEVFSEVREKVVTTEGYIQKLDTNGGSKIFKLLSRVSPDYYAKLVVWLNTLNKQQIANINCQDWTYTVEGVGKLSMSNLSTGEVLYAVVFAADVLRENVYIHYGVSQLTKTSMKRLLLSYKDSQYVTLLCPNIETIGMYHRLMEGCYD